MAEIGGEFMTNSYKRGNNKYVSLVNFSKRYVLSGRTGLYLIAEELKNCGIVSVALPSYCCGSMVLPFIEAGMRVSFYDNNIPNDRAVLIMDYFGYESEKSVKLARICRDKGIKIIIDATQTAFSELRTYDLADFIVVSYRKWFDCLCAAVYSRNGFSVTEYVKEANEFVHVWREAARKKRDYIINSNGNKQDFLDLYAKANYCLTKDYIGYSANKTEIERFENVDSDFIRSKRRNNAITLMKALNGRVNLMFSSLNEEDCPLHLPVILPNEERMYLKNHLIQEEIYCPCHWPINQELPHRKTLFHEEEISLICDQRYTVNDMIREADILIRILERRR